MGFYDLLESSDGLIGHGTGLVNVNGAWNMGSPNISLFMREDYSDIIAGLVKFRMIVFRPFKGEIILGKITSATEQGIKSE